MTVGLASEPLSDELNPPHSEPNRSWGPDLNRITEIVSRAAERPIGADHALALLAMLALGLILLASLVHLVTRGIGVWGNDQNVQWAWDIAGFVFWIGIGHAGTLISAVLFLFRQKWRTAVSRAAEAVTLCAVLTAAVYPVFHMGRVWLAYWLFPVPNQMRVWPNLKSPLVWDVFAIGSYFTVSLLFWYLGLVPDLALWRERALPGLRRRILEKLSLGWNGSQQHYLHYQKAYLLLAGLATPLVISVHTVVSFDFAVSVIPGWHSTIFPPYFVVGAVLSGSAMVVTLMVAMRWALGLREIITQDHLDAMNKLILVTGSLIAYCYGIEWYFGTTTADPYERMAALGRFTGPYAWAAWSMLACNVLAPQLFWFRALRRNTVAMVAICMLVNGGMWLERFVIIVTSQHRSFLPATWSNFHPTLIDVSTFAGTVGFFLLLFVAFLRFLPVISMSEVKAMLVEQDGEWQSRHELENQVRHADARNAHPASVRTATSSPRRQEQPRAVLFGWYRDSKAIARAAQVLSVSAGTELRAYGPHPLDELQLHLGPASSPIPRITLFSGLLGAAFALCAQWWIQTSSYPLVIGGKALGTWQAYVPITFEVAILSSAIGCFIGLWYMCGLPRKQHADLHGIQVGRANDDQYCLAVEVDAADSERVRRILYSTGAELTGEGCT